MAFNPNVLTEKAAQTLNAAITLASERGHSQIVPPHLAYALLADKDGLSTNILARAGGNANNAMQELDRIVLQKLSSQSPPPAPSLSQALLKVIQDADALKKQQEDSYVSVDHLLLA